MQHIKMDALLTYFKNLSHCGQVPEVRQLKMLLRQGAFINYQCIHDGTTVLMLAVQLKYDRMAEYLLKQGADPLLKNNEKKMASELVSNQASVYPILKNYELLFASMNNDLVSVQLIINEGGLVNFQGPNDYTALMIATEQNQVELVDYLLNIGACLLLKRIDGSTVFDLATDPLIIELLSTTKKFDEAAKEHRELNVKKLTPSFFLSMK